MRIIVLGDKSRYQFLRELIGGAENRSLRTESLAGSLVKVTADRNIAEQENCYYSEKIPLFTELIFPDEWETHKVECCVNDKVLFFDEFPYRSDKEMQFIENFMKNDIVYCEIVLVRNYRKHLESDISDEEMALQEAQRSYAVEEYPVRIYGFGEKYDFLFWNAETIVADHKRTLKRKIKEIKENIEFGFEVDYDVKFLEFKLMMDNPAFLDLFVKYDKRMKNKKLFQYFCGNAEAYFWKQNREKYSSFIRNIYSDYMGSICVWDMEKDMAELVEQMELAFHDFLKRENDIIYSGEEDGYAFFMNSHLIELINFKNDIRGFWELELKVLLKKYMESRISRLEALMDEKIY